MNKTFIPQLKNFKKDYQSPYRQVAKSNDGGCDVSSAQNGSTRNFMQMNIERVTHSKKDVDEVSQEECQKAPVFESKIPKITRSPANQSWKFKTFTGTNKRSSIDSTLKSPTRTGYLANHRRGTVPDIAQE